MFRKLKPVPAHPSPKPGRQYRCVLPDASVIGIAVVV